MSDYRVGDIVVFLRNSSAGGVEFGREVQRANIKGSCADAGYIIIILIEPDSGQYTDVCYANLKDIKIAARIRKLSGFGSFVKRLDSEDRVQP